MSDRIEIAEGAAPWQPTEDSELVLELHRYDMPLLGVLRQHGTFYLFECLWGAVGPASVWAYQRIEDRDVDRLSTTDELNRSRALVDELLGADEVSVAFATESEGVTVTARVQGAASRQLVFPAMEALHSAARGHYSDVDAVVAAAS